MTLGLNLGLNQSICLKEGLRCPVCGAVDSHASGCLMKMRDDLNLQRRQINCPKCKDGSVDVNTEDFFECGNCHTQFCRSGFADSPEPERVLLVDNRSGEYFPVLVLVTKGKGKIRIDMQIASIQKRIDAIVKSKSRPRSKN